MGGMHGDPAATVEMTEAPACASGLRSALTPSRFMLVATPIASVLLTMLIGAIIFELLGFDGPRAVYEIFITPIVASYKWQDVADQGRAADHHRARPVARQSRQGLEHRRRGPVHHRRAVRRGRRASPAATRKASWIIPLMIARRHCRRRGLGGDPGAAADALPRQRDAVEPDAGLCRAAGAELSRRRPVEGPERPQLPADAAAHRRPDAAARRSRNRRFRRASSSPSFCRSCSGCSTARSVFGFQIRTVGARPSAARYGGFDAKRTVWSTLLISGGMAGLAGILEATSQLRQINLGFPSGYGFTAIIVSFLGRLHPIGVLHRRHRSSRSPMSADRWRRRRCTCPRRRPASSRR